MSSSAGEIRVAGVIAPTGDREVAGLLSSLAEAPDFVSAASFLLERIADVTRSKRGGILRVDLTREALAVVTSLEIDDPPEIGPSLEDLSHPLVLSALSLSAVPELPTLDLPAFGAGPWAAIPFSQPRGRSVPQLLPQQQAAEIATKANVKLMPLGERRLGAAPAGVILLSGPVAPQALEAAVELVTLASPVIARLASLEEALEHMERLRQQRERLTLMVDSLPDPVVITDASNDIIVQNQRAVRLLNAQDGDSSGRRRAIELNNLLFTSFLSRAIMMGRAGAPGEGARELSLVDPDEGNDLLFEVLAHPLGTRAGPEDAVLSVLRDVTDLRRAANELERQVQRVRLAEQKATGERDRLNLILENVADPILVTDERSNIILMNEQAEQLFQVPGSEPRSRRELQAVRGNDTKFTSFISEFALLAANSRRERMTLQYPATGRELPVEVVSGKIRNDRGEAIAIVSVLHDLTKEVEIEHLFEALKRLNSELEERIREATADLAEQNARLQWQSQEVERANRLKSEFLASMSHELRTPINALIGYAALLLDGVLGEINARQSDALQRGRAAAEHLLALINDILDLAKIEAGKMPLHPESVALREIINEVALQIEPMVRKKALELRIDVSPECPLIHTDRTKVKQVLLNLLSNAVKFTNKGGVSVEGRCAPGGVRIDVVDTGIGIRESDLQAIWEDFRQVDQSRTREYGGTGLGLSITRKLLDRLGGSVTVKSVYGEGSTFSVFLPLRTPASHHDDAGPAIPVRAP